MARTGRRPGRQPTRDRILAAARAAFAEAGLDGATIRQIARGAGVDPALVYHYFGSKEALFIASIELPFEPSALAQTIVEGGVEGIGERIMRFALGVWAQPNARTVLVGVARSAAGDERAASALRGLLESTLLVVVRRLNLDHPELRAALAWSQLVGVFFGRFVLQVRPLVEADPERLVAAAAPGLQAVLTGPIEARPALP